MLELEVKNYFSLSKIMAESLTLRHFENFFIQSHQSQHSTTTFFKFTKNMVFKTKFS